MSPSLEMKPMFLFNHIGSQMPNVWKISFLLKELGLECDMQYLDFTLNEQNQSPHIDFNPNGRIPTLVDPNNNHNSVWESNAILIYLVDRYDPDNEFGFVGKSEEERMEVLQWLFFQASGQGPYYGQAHWFKYLHPEEIPSAIKRYQDEIMRILDMLEGHLKGREWIVGSQCTLADFALLPYNLFYAPRLLPEGVTIEDQFPAVSAWQKRLCERAPVRDAIMEREARINQVGSVALFRGERARMEPVLPVVGGLAGAAAG